MALHIIAPTFDPTVVGGAGVALVELTSRFIRDLPGTKIYLNERTARLFPNWSKSVVTVRCGSMTKQLPKAFAVSRLELFGFSGFPVEGLCWFPFGAMIPLSFRGKGVSTIHDTLDRDYPSLLPTTERIFRKVIMPRTVRRTSVVTSSNFSRDRLRHHYNIDATVIRLAVQQLPPASYAKVPASPYVFFPANEFEHKNHRFLIQLWKTRSDLKSIALVFTLGSGSKSLERQIDAARAVGAQVIVTGRITREELAGLYERALCTVLPTLYEGFGLPMQEALMCNCPVLANEACPALFETVTADYPYFLPLDPDRWANAILAFSGASATDVRHYVNHRTWDDCSRDYLKFFSGIDK